MNYCELITSPYYGVVEEICIQQGSLISEGGSLFYIRIQDDTIASISIGINGRVQSIEVSKGEDVIPGMVLACVETEFFSAERD
ncbi:hypothetical protein RYX56_06885 [Alkalihalophilus lindianensis]|uniref:Uncharacterized protein n=1 Tax=Alkalihalophilus lindianensis TaxID=1630542 RepID=A0ABU3X877_9BACI|nr:hypothetical protein [Alkalihalophilus lindianensis]MDV2684091.1 hypothetical protein [Alkalihalophilus lindianensis]